MEVRSLNHWTAREVPRGYLFRVWVVKYRVETAPLLAEVSAGEVVFTLSSAPLDAHYLFNSLCRNRVSKKAEIWEGSVSAPG